MASSMKASSADIKAVLSTQRHSQALHNTEILSNTIYEQDYDEQRLSVSDIDLKENGQITNADDAVNETHKRVSVLRHLIDSGHLAPVSTEPARLANDLIAQSRKSWEKNADWLDPVITALCNAKYPELSVILLAELFNKDSTTTDGAAVETFTSNLMSSIANFTEISDLFRKEMADAGVITVLTNYLSIKGAVICSGDDSSKREKTTLNRAKYSLCLIKNLTKSPELHKKFVSTGCKETLNTYLDCPADDGIQSLTLVAIVHMLVESKDMDWTIAKGIGSNLTDSCYAALVSTDHHYKGLPTEDYASALCTLATYTAWQEKLIQHPKIIPVIRGLLTSFHPNLVEQAKGIELAWQLSFTESGKTLIRREFIGLLKRLAHMSPSVSSASSVTMKAIETGNVLKSNAAKTVAYIENWNRWNQPVLSEKEPTGIMANGESSTSLISNGPPPINNSNNDKAVPQTRDSNVSTEKPVGKIFFSYSPRQKELVHRILDRLSAKGVFNVWVDFDDPRNGSDWNNGISIEIENSAAVVVFYSEEYKLASNCRSEAEYALALQKTIVPVKAEIGYEPDGWLVRIMNSSTTPSIEITLPINDIAFGKLFNEIQKAQYGRIQSALIKSSRETGKRSQSCCSIA